MSDAEQRLAKFWGEDALAEQDHGFALAVAERLARRQFHAGLIWLAGACTVGGMILWACLPYLGDVVARFRPDPAIWAPVGISLVIAVSLLVVVGGPLGSRPDARA